MAITPRNPQTIVLSGFNHTIVNNVPALAAITPGHLIRYANNSGALAFEAHGTADGVAAPIVAMEQSYLNLGIDDAYEAGDQVRACHLKRGETAYMLIASGVTAVPGSLLQSAGDGTLKLGTTATACFVALEGVAAVALSRLRVSAL